MEFSVETNRTVEFCRICRIPRICILVRECWNGVDSLEVLELVEMPGKAGITGMSLEGLVGHTDGLLKDLLAFYV